uniref:Uncharacterized protein n=1 Tax=Arundo donax TaxID=35708 RepID=A0A0A9GQY1_ARUDO
MLRKEESKGIVTGRRMRRVVMIQNSSRSGWRNSEVVLVARIGLDRQQPGNSDVARAIWVDNNKGHQLALGDWKNQ